MMGHDLQRHLDAATAFFLAGERCTPVLAFGNYGQHSLDAPTIVNYAHSVELALKLIHVLASGSKLHGHLVKNLFEALPDDVKAHLPHLGSCVEEIDRYFVDWRYAFEHDFLCGDFDNPRRAFIECYREIRRLRPELVSIYERNWGGFEPDWFWAWPEREVAEIEGTREP